MPGIVLYTDSLIRFADVVGRAAALLPGSGVEPKRSLVIKDGDWRPSHVRRLAHLLEIAAAAGDVDEQHADVARRIADQAREGRLADLSHDASWISAVRWALDDLIRMPPFALPVGVRSREREVGDACTRLRKRGYDVIVDGLGARLEEPSRRQVCRRVASLTRCLGGHLVLDQLFRVLSDQGQLRDGVWMLGDRMPRIDLGKTPTLPYGWLLSLGITHLGADPAPRKPEVAWGTLTSLMIDAAAVMDVERYSSIEGMNVAPGELVAELTAAVAWHQLFTFPRFTRTAVRRLLLSMKAVLTSEERRALGYDLERAEAELDALLSSTSDERAIRVSSGKIKQAYPLLWTWPYKVCTPPNAGFSEPFDTAHRDQERHLFLPTGKSDVTLLPTSVTAAHAATLLVESVWRGLKGQQASKAIGRIYENAVAAICRNDGRAAVRCDVKYYAKPKNLQIDVLVEREQRLTVLEVKSKSLTAQATSGDLLTYLRDIKDSYLSMLLQLMRHERHMRDGHPDLPHAKDSGRIAKVAISPLSFGPISDAPFSRNLLIALSQVRLTPIDGDVGAAEVIAGIHETVDEVASEMNALPSREQGKDVDVLSELMDYHWLDIAQLERLTGTGDDLYAQLKRLRHASFGSRDFWSEISHLDDLNLQ